MEAAAALVALSQNNPDHTRSREPGVLIWDVRTDSRRLEPVFENANGRVNPFGRVQNNCPFSIPTLSDFNVMLAERLWSISLVHLLPPQIELASERFTAGAFLPRSLQVPGRPELGNMPEALGRFIDMWDAYGYTGRTIGQMLFRNCIFFSHLYISQRTGRPYGELSTYADESEDEPEEWHRGFDEDY